MTITFIILGITILLFIQGKIRPDLVALISMVSLYLFGIIDVKALFSGFSDPAVIMIGSLFLVGAGLSNTGVTNYLGDRLMAYAGSSLKKAMVLLILFAGIFSGFLSNTGIVAMLIPAVLAMAYKLKSTPSKLLIPLAFAANTGGLLTVIGTPPNIIVNSVLKEEGYPEFGFFSFSLIGIPLLLTLLVYFFFVGQKLLPSPDNSLPENLKNVSLADILQNYHFKGNLFRLRIRQGARLIGKNLADFNFPDEFGVSVLSLLKSNEKGRIRSVPHDIQKMIIEEDDQLIVRGKPENIDELTKKYRVGIQPYTSDQTGEIDKSLLSNEIGVTQVMISPTSELVGRTFGVGFIAEKYNIQFLGARRGNQLLEEENITLEIGDVLLIRGTWDDIISLEEQEYFFITLGKPEALKTEVKEISPRGYIAIAILLLMITLILLKWVPAAVATSLAALAMVMSGCIRLTRVYSSIGWESVFLIAAMIPMSIALKTTGGAELVASSLVSALGEWDHRVLLGGVFILTALFSQVINNSATTLLMAPIIIASAQSLDVSPLPLLMATAVSASTAFLTPIGTTTNVMVLGPGNYRFKDYLIVGFPLLILFLAVSIFLIPLIWNF